MTKTKKIIKKVLFVLLISCSLYADKVDVTLREFANIVATQNHINILISSKVKQDKLLFYFEDKGKAYVMLPAFKKILQSKGLQLVNYNSYFFIENIVNHDNDLFLHCYKLNNLVSSDAINLLKIYNVKSVFIKSDNSICFNSTEKKFLILSNYLKKIDVKSPQVRFKINIFYTNLDDLKERGFNLSAYTKSVESKDSVSNSTYFLNLITMPYNLPTNVVATAKNGFYATVKYLNQNGFTTIDNSPILTAKSNSSVSFSSVRNIPYLVSTVKQENADKVTTQNLAYKDVGLKIDIKPVVINKNINFDLHLVVEDLINNSNLTPTIEKRELTSSYTLKRGELLVLSGVNKTTSLTSTYGIPVLKEIPLFGNIFKYKSVSKTHSVLTISIEVL